LKNKNESHEESKLIAAGKWGQTPFFRDSVLWLGELDLD